MYGATSPGSISSARYISATTSPAAHSSAPVLHSISSPRAKRSASTFACRLSGVARQSLNDAASAAPSRFLPMKTIFDWRGSSSPHGASNVPEKLMCTAWKTNRSAACAMLSTPFIRKMSSPCVLSSSWIQFCASSRSRAPGSTVRMWRGAPWSRLTLPTDASCWVGSASTLSSCGLACSARCKSKPWIPSTESTETVDCRQRTIGAKGLRPRSRASTRSSSRGLTRSVLLSSSRSANATCALASLTTPFGFFAFRWRSTCFASTKVTMPSSRANSAISSCTKNVCATGAGSAMPVVSMMMPSSASSPARVRAASFSRILTRSPRTEQQMQPLSTSTISSSSVKWLFLAMSASSIETSPNSFSTTAIFLPCVAVRMWFNKVVLPLPRKPVMIVTGTRSESGVSTSISSRTIVHVASSQRGSSHSASRNNASQ